MGGTELGVGESKHVDKEEKQSRIRLAELQHNEQ